MSEFTLKALLLGAALSCSTMAHGASISLIDGTHDMVNGSATDSGISAPALGLVGLGHTTTKYTAGQYDMAMAANDILIIEQAAVNLSEAADMNTFMTSGGTIIQAGGSGFSLPNTWFGTSITQAAFAGSFGKTASATSGIYAPYFSDDPATLSTLSSTHPANGVPVGGTVLYGSASQAQVFHVGVGAGNYFYIGWDYCCAGTQAQRDDYYKVLDSAIAFAVDGGTPGPAVVPLPAGLPLLLGGLGLFGLMRRRSLPTKD